LLYACCWRRRRPNLGNEQLWIRAIHDIDGDFRLGATLKPYVGSEPKMKPFAADQFFEWFPWGTPSSYKRGVPYVAIGLDEEGVEKVYLTYQAQLGVYWGNHMRREKHQTIRAVAGYYRGIDPRLKYAQFLLGRADFGYVGAMFDL
jgi:hypothetical protein